METTQIRQIRTTGQTKYVMYSSKTQFKHNSKTTIITKRKVEKTQNANDKKTIKHKIHETQKNKNAQT